MDGEEVHSEEAESIIERPGCRADPRSGQMAKRIQNTNRGEEPMTTIRKIALSISALGVFGLAVVLVASAVGEIASADHDDGEGRANSFIGLWQTIQSNSDGALQTLSISDTNRDGEFQIALHESFYRYAAASLELSAVPPL